MALIVCPTCGRDISSTVDACPNCGAEAAVPVREVQSATLAHAAQPARSTPAAQHLSNPASPPWLEALRWLALLPLSVAATLIVTGGARIFIQIGSRIVTPLSAPGDDAGWWALLGAIIPPALGGFALVVCAVLVTPRFARATALIFMMISLTLAVIQAVDYITQARLIDVLAPICASGGSIYAAILTGAFRRSGS